MEDVRADGNTLAGIWVEGTGSVVRNNQVVTTTGSTVAGATNPSGIYVVGTGARVLTNDVVDAVSATTGVGTAIYVDSANGSVIAGNRVGTGSTVTNTRGILLAGTNNAVVLGNSLTVLASGVEFSSSSGQYRDNIAAGVTTPYTGGTDAGNNQ